MIEGNEGWYLGAMFFLEVTVVILISVWVIS